ncbi:ABC transporter substrate-binding protein [Candidatus Woesearchaeota archaeon]|nr:ABC transporter substrate-binding protein [Candidatus Woesearchaeota archaeon]MBW3021938.1 ABC transporter substrate-binding protein [Candidatus Woesearchaeota archaeon]
MVKNKLIFGIIVVLVLVAGCSEDTIKIGFSGPLTGPVARLGEWSLRGAQTAIDEINEAGGIDGKMLELVVEDDQCSAQPAVTAVNKMQTQGIDKFIVVCSANSPAVAPVTEGKSIVFTPSFRLMSLEGKFPHYFSLQPSMRREVTKLFEYVEEQGYETLGIIYNQNDFYESYREIVVEIAEKQGVDVISIQPSDWLASEFRVQLAKLKKADPDVIFAGLNPGPYANMLKQKKELGIDIPVIGIWYTQTPDLMEGAGELADGIVYTYHYKAGSTPEITEYSELYEKRYGEQAEFSSASTYDMVYIMKDLIERCDDSECMVDKVKELDFEGASGKIKFSKSSTLKEINLKTIHDGEFVELE